MQRSKFPYTARSSAKVIRHAVSIDERRAKFRQDLLSEVKTSRKRETHHQHHFRHARKPHAGDTHRSASAATTAMNGTKAKSPNADRFRRPSRVRLHSDSQGRSISPQISPAVPRERQAMLDVENLSLHSSTSSYLPEELKDPEAEDDEDESAGQDIEELWFPGCHADLGGGWPIGDGEESPLSHAPLVWIVREAQHAGLEFDSEQMLALHCCDDHYNNEPTEMSSGVPAPPLIQVTRTESDRNVFNSPRTEKEHPGWAEGMEPGEPRKSYFHRRLEVSAGHGLLHDCLEFNNGLPRASVLSWKIMEYLPFRRMDLQPDGSWKAISFPLPMGEVRDIPEDAWIHHSAIKRMEVDPNYRPGNLIVGGGGRGMRKAPKELGIGDWSILKGDNDPVGCAYVRKHESLDLKVDRVQHGRDMEKD